MWCATHMLRVERNTARDNRETFGRMKCAVGRPAHSRAPLHTGGSPLREDATKAKLPALLRGQGRKETCHSTKRTHFVFGEFALYQFYLQQVMPFAEAFANGFVFQNEPILGRVLGVRLPQQLRCGICHRSTACGVSSDSAPSDSVWDAEEGINGRDARSTEADETTYT